METIIKVLKAMFFNDEEVDVKFATKFKYVVYGMVLGAALTLGGLLYLGDDEDVEEDDVEYVEGEE